MLNNGFHVVATGKRPGRINDVEILAEFPAYNADIHTVTMYLNVQNQEQYRKDILKLKPKRVIFNPGSENPDFAADLKTAGIEVLNACTLVLLSIGDY